jgi:hypothetical protein
VYREKAGGILSEESVKMGLEDSRQIKHLFRIQNRDATDTVLLFPDIRPAGYPAMPDTGYPAIPMAGYRISV